MTIKEWSYEIKALRDEAKAIWGEEKYIRPYNKGANFAETDKKMWQYHLAQMLLSDDPVKYLKENTK